MAVYTPQEIAEFLKAANRDLGHPQYEPPELKADYAKAVIIALQLQAENKRLAEKQNNA